MALENRIGRFGSFSRAATGGIVLSAMVVFVLLVWQTVRMWEHGQEFSDRFAKMHMLAGDIVRLDEVLTMYTLMAAATGEKRWERLYRRTEPELTRVFENAREMLEEDTLNTAVTQADKANVQLVAMEVEAFALIDGGQREQALELLLSSRYLSFKSDYNLGVKRLARNLEQMAESHRQESEKDLTLFLWFAAAALATLLCFFLSVFLFWGLASRSAGNRPGVRE